MAQAEKSRSGSSKTATKASKKGASRSPENYAATKEARNHFRKGLDHFKARQYRKAIFEFQLAAKRVPSADLTYNIARAHEELREYEPAIKLYREYLRDRVDPPDRVQVEARIAELENAWQEQLEARKRQPKTARLRLSLVEELEPAIMLDGQETPPSEVGQRREVEPGKHAVQVTQDGYIPQYSELNLDAGDDVVAYADLRPKRSYEAVRGKPRWTWLMAALTVASIGATVGLGVRAQQLDNQGDVDSARKWSRYSDGFLGASVILGVGTVVTYFIERRSVATRERTLPAAKPATAAQRASSRLIF